MTALNIESIEDKLFQLDAHTRLIDEIVAHSDKEITDEGSHFYYALERLMQLSKVGELVLISKIVYFHPRFQKSYRKLDTKTRVQAEFRVKLFKTDLFAAILGTHRLHGKLNKQSSFSVNIGDHSIYK